eukprot:10124626-Alexandrium_andersonii.AAC.1
MPCGPGRRGALSRARRCRAGAGAGAGGVGPAALLDGIQSSCRRVGWCGEFGPGYPRPSSA